MTQIDQEIIDIYVAMLKEDAFIYQCKYDKDEIMVEYWATPYLRVTDIYKIEREYGYIYKDEDLSYTSTLEDLGL